jgi:TetR/AcrR family acrAB operon transcriptional repressor
MARPQQRGADSRRELISIAIDCFARDGYHATSIDRIARAAGVTKGALYYHFRDKEALLFGALDDRVSGFEQRVVERVTRLKDPVAALYAVGEICVEQATRSNHRRFLLTLMVEALDTHPALSERFRQMMKRFREFLANTVRIGQRRGAFRKDVDAALAAQLFVAALVGTEIQYYQDPRAIDLARSVHAATSQFCAWLGVRRPRSATPTPLRRRIRGVPAAGRRSER